MDSFNGFSCFFRSELAYLWSSKLVGESIGTEVNRVTFFQFYFCIGEVCLVFEDTSSDWEFVTLNLVQDSTFHYVEWTMRSRILNFPGICVDLTQRDVHTILSGSILILAEG